MSIFTKFISDSVGNNMENKSTDIIKTKYHFSRIGLYNEPIKNGYIDKELDTAIHSFQEKHNLKRDGYMLPNKETEKTLHHIISSKNKIERETLPPPEQKKHIPGTNIPDLGIPEQGYPNSKVFNPHRPKFNENPDPHFDKKPKPIDPEMEIQNIIHRLKKEWPI